MFAKLKRFNDTHGHCNVPTDWADDQQLATWVNTVRARRDKLSIERRDQLDNLRFVWDARDFLWEAMFVELREFKDKHGHCNVPQLSLEKIANWVHG